VKIKKKNLFIINKKLYRIIYSKKEKDNLPII